MDRVAIIFDQLKDKHTLTSGNNLVEIEIVRKTSNPHKGYLLLLDQKTPLVQKESLNIGPEAELTFTISCMKSGQWEITSEESERIIALFDRGSKSLRQNIERTASQIKSKLVSNNCDPFFVYTLLDAVFPDIQRMVDEELIKIEKNFPHLRLGVQLFINISNKLDNILDQSHDLLRQAWLKTATDPLQSAYEPEEEYEQRRKNFNQAKEMLPLPSRPSENDIQQAKKIIIEQQQLFRNQKRFGILGDRLRLSDGK